MLDFNRYYKKVVVVCSAVLLLFASCENNEEVVLQGTISTVEVTGITSNSATVRGYLEVTTGFRANINESGFSISLSPNPTIYESRIIGRSITDNTVVRYGAFTATITGLQRNTTYFVRAYTITTLGTSYGREIRFTTLLEDPEPPSPFFIMGNVMIDERDRGASITWEEARVACENSVSGGFTDWRLPTIEELARMYGKRNEIGGFAQRLNAHYLYWSSTLARTTTSWGHESNHYYVINFNTGQRQELYENIRTLGFPHRTFCRCVRTLP